MPLYFAYGANMARAAMAARCPRSTPLGPARLMRHRLAVMREGWLTVVRDPAFRVHGVLWDLALSDVAALDRFEGVAEGLYVKAVQPVVGSSGPKRALVYLGTNDGPGQARADYVREVLDAARELEPAARRNRRAGAAGAFGRLNGRPRIRLDSDNICLTRRKLVSGQRGEPIAERPMSATETLDAPNRLNALDSYDILDTGPEESLDRITRLVCRLFQVKLATLTFVDGHRQWFKSRQGLDLQQTAREPSFCRRPVAEGAPLIVPDTLADPRFRDNEFVCGEPNLRFYAGVPLRSAEGAIVGTLCAMDREPHSFRPEDLASLLDLGKMVENELELRRLATTDALTHTLSRRAFRLEAERAIALAERHRYDLSCIAFDLDHFKAINDSAGHAAGDAVLAMAADTCRSQLRKSDLLGRLGGEEFAILLPHSTPADSLAVAEKLRAGIARQVMQGPNGPISVTASFGVATLGGDVDTLLARADEAMYEAKRAGRNLCRLWQGREVADIGDARRVLKAGNIVFNQGASAIDCTVRRLSSRGAKLDVITSDGVPRKFKLQIPADDFSRACTVVGKDRTHIEVVFG